MKEIMDSAPSNVASDEGHFANRKLIRPSLPRVEHNHGNHNSNHNSNHGSNHMHAERRERHDRGADRGDRSDRGGDRGFDRSGSGRKAAPPETTNAENFYYQKQMQSRTPMVVVLQDGEEVHGIIEWYDKACIKVNREDGNPNVMIYKPAIKYMYKEEESGR
jgi:host factor-I protein